MCRSLRGICGVMIPWLGRFYLHITYHLPYLIYPRVVSLFYPQFTTYSSDLHLFQRFLLSH
jgi:hypothetical protein